jgi:Fe-S cluster assembly iron-binding protein IscA
MLHLTHDAAELVRTLVSESHLPESAGLRLHTDDASHALVMDLEPAPSEHDAVVEEDGASVWLSPDATERLEDQTLRAQLEPRRAFFLA